MANVKPEKQIAKIEKNPYNVVNIDNLTKEAAIRAIELDWDVFGHLPQELKDDNDVRLAVVDQFGLSIVQFSKTATDEQWHRACLQDPEVISFIKKPQEDTIWAVLSADPNLIDYIHGATDEHRAAAVLLS